MVKYKSHTVTFVITNKTSSKVGATTNVFYDSSDSGSLVGISGFEALYYHANTQRDPI